MGLMNKRLFVEKKPGFQVASQSLCDQLRLNLNLDIKSVRSLIIYDIFNIQQDDFEKAKQTVFSEVMVDQIFETLDLSDQLFLAMETLPGQYDQRADSAVQCIQLLNPSTTCQITTGQLLLFEGNLSTSDLKKIENYCINPIESRVKNLNLLQMDQNVEITPLQDYSGFIHYSSEELHQFWASNNFAMSFSDLQLTQTYFISEKRDPTETELKVLDTYWSDHCRHTTFETYLSSITIQSERFQEALETAYQRYRKLRTDCQRDEKPETLMDMATINSRYLRSKGLLPDVEISSEINACSVFIDVDHNGQNEKWLLQFKNETHNHPTEIEPFGGASTCIGGAIRDPLSGRSYVYQAMRITGSGDITTPLDQTLDGKLPQSIISKKSALGNSSYGNQIGLPTTYVRELYHDGYVAKHLEVGAVVGAVKADAVVRTDPQPNDCILLLGGRTGRDGIGGATGSSKQHTQASLDTCSSEVQKGNAPEERKIQRLFRNPDCSKLIKKCNDFGAGGVCVAIGELADGLEIQLDLVPVKYAGLNPTEIAISESQERMAVVIDPQDVNSFIALAESENIEVTKVAVVTDTHRLVMKYHDLVVVDISRDFLDSAGAIQQAHALITDSNLPNPIHNTTLSKEALLTMISDRNVACQKGLVEHFDASIGSTTVLMPFGGTTQLTPTQASVQKIPVLDGKTKTCSILTYGFNPKLMEYSPFTGAMFSILESISKTIAVGGKLENIYFSFQEYFERLNFEEEKWGKVSAALLGALMVQDKFCRAAIGGKDSMSGTFNNLSVPPTFISFACSAAHVDHIISPELKQPGNLLGVLLPEISKEGLPNLDSYQELFSYAQTQLHNQSILSSYVVEEGGIAAACFKMSFGNQLGFNIQSSLDLMKLIPGALVVETKEPLNSPLYHQLGHITESDYLINSISLSFDEVLSSWTNFQDSFYPQYAQRKAKKVQTLTHPTTQKRKAKHSVEHPKVCIATFPGTNCEMDMKRAFEQEGAIGEIVVFKNKTAEDILSSIDDLVRGLDQSHIFALPGGFSSGDEPDGSAKFIVNVLQNEKVKEAVHRLLDRDGLILGICNGFQALLKSGLLPYGKIQTLQKEDATLFRNDIHRHVSTIASTRVCSVHSPWLQDFSVGDTHQIAFSHGEGKFCVSDELLNQLISNGQVAFQYCDHEGQASSDPQFNINGSDCAIEGITSIDGRILGKMGHSERFFDDVFKNIPGHKHQNIFASGVNYFKKEV